jgi:hypothetical protein
MAVAPEIRNYICEFIFEREGSILLLGLNCPNPQSWMCTSQSIDGIDPLSSPGILAWKPYEGSLPTIWLEENGRTREAEFLEGEVTTRTAVNETPDQPDYKEFEIQNLPSGTEELEKMCKAEHTIEEGVGEVWGSDGDEEEEVGARADEEETKDAEDEEQEDKGATYNIDEGAELETEGVIDCKDKDMLDRVL